MALCLTLTITTRLIFALRLTRTKTVFITSLAVSGRVTRQCLQPTSFEEKDRTESQGSVYNSPVLKRKTEQKWRMEPTSSGYQSNALPAHGRWVGYYSLLID